MTLDLHPFVEAFNSTVADLMRVEPQNGPIEAHAGAIRADISVFFSLATDSPYHVIMTVTEPAAVEFVARILGQRPAFDEPIVVDTVAEVFNTVVGSAQSRSRQRFTFTIPVVSRGHNHEVRAYNGGRLWGVVSRVFNEQIGLFLVEGDPGRGRATR